MREANAQPIAQALAQAERDHLLECPNAEFGVRTAAIVLDGILLYLMLSGAQNVFTAIGDQLPSGQGSLASGLSLESWLQTHATTILNYVASATKVSLIYGYLLWPAQHHGGSPGKLLLGLRLIQTDGGRWLRPLPLLFREIGGKFSLAVSISGLSQGMWEFSALLVFSVAGFALAALRPDRKTAFDLFSGSQVKRLHSGAER